MKSETRPFEAEVSRLFDLVTHSLYSNKEVFLRELISNASDALDKLRFEALSHPELKSEDPKIWIELHPEKREIILRDNGMGMSREEAIENLGMIAKSGTRAYAEGHKEDVHNLIGQFGVGFYSAFIVADKVTVNSRRVDLPENQGVSWTCEGKGEYHVQTIEKKAPGTEIILHLKEGEDEFLESFRIRSLIKKYSDHISFPILMQKESYASEKPEEKSSKKEEAKSAPEFEAVNQASALWTLPRDKITDEDYKTFYKHVAHDFQEPLLWSHNKVEGKLEYTTLLYIPSHAPFGLWNREQQHGLKLYVQRVFIMDNAEKLLPLYLRFVRGVVDSSDLPLNVSRELLQSHHVVDSIRSGCTRKVLEMLKNLAQESPEKYQTFWNQIGQVLKEGIGEDFAHKDQIAKLLRFASTHDNKPDQTVSLEAYISRMKPGQDKIYYLIGDSFNAVKNSPHLEIFRKKGIEVLLLFDRIDEWLVTYLREFEGKPLQSVAKGDLDIEKVAGDEEAPTKTAKSQQDAFEGVLKQLKAVLAEKAEDVRLTDRLTDSPACLVAGQEELSRHLQQMLKEAGQAVPEHKPILELNPDHKLVQQLKDEIDEDRFKDRAHILFDSALLAEGGHLTDPATFVNRVNRFLSQG